MSSISGLKVTPLQRAQFEPGALLSGKYRIVSLIGVGGVGRVYLARHIELDTEVAIKVLRPEMAERTDAVQRFAREARASVRLRSEHVARIFDVGTHEGTPYFVMEHMVGSNLLELRQQESIDIPTLCEFFVQACEGLADAHAQGVVHRDIKPENLFVVRSPLGWRTLKIFDFGISKFSLTGKYSDVDLAAMRTEVMMGTPHYISPEQIRSTRDVDHRTDIWSLGVVMFEVLSGGILPFREEREVTALIAEVLERPHRSLLDVAPNVPEALATIVDRCLEKDPEHRYQNAAELAIDLLPLAPARARASAERAVSAMQAAGLMALNADLTSARPSQNPPSHRPPMVTPLAVLPPVSSTRAVTIASARVAAPAAPVVQDEPSKRKSRLPLLAALLGLLSVAAVAAHFTSRHLSAPSEATPTAAAPAVEVTVPAAVAAPAAPSPVRSVVSAPEAPSTELARATSAAAPRPAVRPPAVVAARAAAPRPAAPKVSPSITAPDPPAATKVELRRER